VLTGLHHEPVKYFARFHDGPVEGKEVMWPADAAFGVLRSRRSPGSGDSGMRRRGVASRRYALLSAAMMARQKAGRSSGLREVIRLPSTTTSASCQSALAAFEIVLVHDFREVFEKNAPTSGRILRLPQSGQAAPFSCSPMVCLTETSLRHLSQKYS
jgi:hypothetical protein